MDLMESFAKRKYLRRKTNLEYFKVSGWPILHLEEPALLARFAAEAKQQGVPAESMAKVLTRGQTEHYGSMRPSLFRAATSSVKELRKAERSLAERVRNAFPMKRFSRANLTALLQHYGIKTSWLDLLDNIWMAIWFATHDLVELGPGLRGAARTAAEFGWVYFVRTELPDGRQLDSVDLRQEHHSLSVRPHIQHGFSVRNAHLEDISDFVFATVRFPNDYRWTLAGYIFDPGVVFPPKRFDNTLKHLSGRKLRGIIEAVQRDYGLEAGSLGEVFEIRGVAY